MKYRSVCSNKYKYIQNIRDYHNLLSTYWYTYTDICSNGNIFFHILHPHQADPPPPSPSPPHRYQQLTLFFLTRKSDLQRTIRIFTAFIGSPFWGYSVVLCDRNLVECSKNTMAEYWGERRGEERSPTGLDKKYWVKPGNIFPGLIGGLMKGNLGSKVNIEILSGIQIVRENQ